MFLDPGALAPPPPTSAIYTTAAVAADHPLAARAGAEILAQGGNAVDAAVATSFALSVVRPGSCGIGGGGFMLIALPSHRKHPGKKNLRIAINYRETAPGWATPDVFMTLDATDPTASTLGGRAAGVPGTVAGLLRALDDYGTLPRDKVLGPAIRLAREGYPVDEAHAQAAAELTARARKDPTWAARFTFALERLAVAGHARPGDMIKVPEQAEALELIARDGAKAFYEGPIAQAIVRACAKDAESFRSPVAIGTMTLADLRAFRPIVTTPLEFTFEGQTFLTMPPPSSGGVALAQTLGILGEREVAAALKDAERDPRSGALLPTPAYTHLLIESFKHAFADRAEWMGDPAFGDLPVKRLLSGNYLRERAATINPSRTQGPDAYGSRDSSRPRAAPSRDGGTSHLCVVDERGGAVACTETINLEFGSLLTVEPFGFTLNNQMDDFTTHAGKPNAFGLMQSPRNAPQKGKRPLSSMTPTIVLDATGTLRAVAGPSGGPPNITSTTPVRKKPQQRKSEPPPPRAPP
ncbi:MAG: gamma-glutamyltransferase family protein, partial [Phycisphaerales bacterium]